MIPWFKNLIYDERCFANVIRALVFAAGELPSVIDLGANGWWLGKVLQASALLIRAGDRNQTT